MVSLFNNAGSTRSLISARRPIIPTEVLVTSLILNRKMPEQCLTSGHDRFLPHPFPFIVHLSHFIRRYTVRVNEKASLSKLQINKYVKHPLFKDVSLISFHYLQCFDSIKMFLFLCLSFLFCFNTTFHLFISAACICVCPFVFTVHDFLPYDMIYMKYVEEETRDDRGEDGGFYK
jgi:ribosomal protein L33